MRRFICRTGRVLLMALACAGAHAADLVVAVTPATVPFSYPDASGELTGFNVEFTRAICRKLGQSCRFEATPFPRILPMVSEGKADIGVGNTLKTPERERLVSFTLPYWRSTTSFLGASGTLFRDARDALDRHKVCAIEGSRQSDYLRASGGTVAHLVLVGSNQDGISSVRQGRCALYLAPTMQVLGFLQSPEGKGFGFLGAALSEQGLGGNVHMAVRPDQPELLRRVDQAIKELILDGTHEQLSRRYFPFSIL